ncbi:diacylglycerol kinase [Bremerella sp. JC817]|uniref:diacylglycerol kinase n=1 Tax=Bremerella sp. JC817 TaxID=3231756 RepID=UPI00345A6838
MKNDPTPSGWIRKFRLAFSGIFWAIRTETSFSVHLPLAAIVIAAAALLQFDQVRWAILWLTIGLVLVAELLNTALESMARAVDQEFNVHLKRALDVGSGAVLVSSMFATVVGVMLFWNPFWAWYAS